MRTRVVLLVVASTLVACSVQAIQLRQSVFDQNLQQIRYSIQSDEQRSGQQLAPVTEGSGKTAAKPFRYKSPGKAFLLSALVPGLGQYYYGSRIKPWVFFGVDVASWVLYFKYHGDGNTATDQFEAFQRAHWSRDRYSTYLEAAYGVSTDDSVVATEVSHHLPTTETGQYFEMTGKYDQFAWGWDDAQLNNQPLDSLLYLQNELAITSPAKTPHTANRLYYENLRHDANVKFDHATNMVIVAITNRLISGFEAYFMTKAHNRNANSSSGDEFSQVHFETSLKSVSTQNDTPFLTAYYKF